MSVAPIDLSALDSFNLLDTGKGAGTPLMLDLDRLHEDPNQPRKDFDDIMDLAQSVSEVGIKVPISVRPHPVMDGHYMVKFGARRRRAAIAAGLSQIPAWIDVVPSDFEQVIENLQRANLTPMELATFMADKQSAGMKHAEIAQKLGIHRTAVSKHLALINAPAEIEAVYRSGRNTSPETIFELRSLFTRFPDETRAWLAKDVEVSRRSVEDLKRVLSAGSETDLNGGSEGTAQKASKAVSDPNDIKRPVVAVKVVDRFGIIVLSRRAAADDHLLVKWDDTGEVSSVSCREVSILRLDDARRYEPINRGVTDLSAARVAARAMPKGAG